MISQLLQNIRSTDKAKVAKSGGIAILISLGLQAAVYAGVAIPVWGQFAGVAAGLIAHALLPAKIQAVVDQDVDMAIDIATTIPQTYAEYPTQKNGSFNDPVTPAKTNINQGQ